MTIASKVRAVLREPRLMSEYVGWLSQRLYRGDPVRHYHGVRVSGFCDFSEYHSFTAMLDAAERAFLGAVAPHIETCVDVGSNIGAWSLHLSSLNDRIRIFAFEADRNTYFSQLHNIMLNANGAIQPFNYAIGDCIALMQFAANPRARATQSFATDRSEGTVGVPCTTLDALAVAGLISKQVDLLKVDVEGFEELVFHGAKDMLCGQRVNMVYFEHCPALLRRAGLSVEAPIRLLQESGYDIFQIAEGGKLEAFFEKGEEDYVLKNLVGISESFLQTGVAAGLRRHD